MGIHNLHPFLRNKCPECYHDINLSQLSGQRIAVDVSLYMYKYKVTQGEWWIRAFLKLIMCLRRNNVHCVFIYDTGCCQEKLAERARRMQGKNKLEDKTTELRYAIDEYKRTKVVLPVMQRVLDRQKSSQKIKRLLGKDNFVDLKCVERYLDKLETQSVSITRKDINYSKKLFSLLGVPYFDAELEAETLCAILAREGKVLAGLSEDTDVLAYYCPMFLHNINTSRDTCTVLIFEQLLAALKLEKAQFRDLCIMCGNDYNPNLKGIGPNKAYDLLIKHQNLDNLAKLEDITPLNHIRSRELFGFKPTFLPDIQFCSEPNWAELEIFLSKTNCRVPFDALRKCFANKKIIFEDAN